MKKWFENAFFALLGIHCSQFPEEWKITQKGRDALKAEQAAVTGLSGMTCVVPAESIIALLDTDEIAAERTDGTGYTYTPSVNPV